MKSITCISGRGVSQNFGKVLSVLWLKKDRRAVT